MCLFAACASFNRLFMMFYRHLDIEYIHEVRLSELTVFYMDQNNFEP